MSNPLKTKYKFIHFVETEEVVSGKKVWDCRNNKSNDLLSKIFYYKPWNEYCFTQSDRNILFNNGCLKDTINFIEQLNKTRK